MGTDRVSLVFVLSACSTNPRNRPVSLICTSAHWRLRSSPMRQPVESAATISAPRCGAAAAVSRSSSPGRSRRARTDSAPPVQTEHVHTLPLEWGVVSMSLCDGPVEQAPDASLETVQADLPALPAAAREAGRLS